MWHWIDVLHGLNGEMKRLKAFWFVIAGCFQGRIFINQANVTYSDDISVNGIFHEIDRILFPPYMEQMNVRTQHSCRVIYWFVSDWSVKSWSVFKLEKQMMFEIFTEQVTEVPTITFSGFSVSFMLMFVCWMKSSWTWLTWPNIVAIKPSTSCSRWDSQTLCSTEIIKGLKMKKMCW